MKRAWLTVQSALLWAVSGIHFAVVGTFLVGLAIFVDRNESHVCTGSVFSFAC